MFKPNRRGGTIELSDKSPLEKVARFLAAQAWSREIQRPSTTPAVPQTDAQQRTRYALEASEYMDRRWREYIGPAQLLIRTCLRRPNRTILSRICATTGTSESLVIAILDAAVEHTASDITVPDPHHTGAPAVSQGQQGDGS